LKRTIVANVIYVKIESTQKFKFVVEFRQIFSPPILQIWIWRNHIYGKIGFTNCGNLHFHRRISCL